MCGYGVPWNQSCIIKTNLNLNNVIKRNNNISRFISETIKIESDYDGREKKLLESQSHTPGQWQVQNGSERYKLHSWTARKQMCGELTRDNNIKQRSDLSKKKLEL